MKILYITTFGGTMGFFKDFIKELVQDGNVVDIATNINYSDVPACYREWGCKIYPLSCTRSPFDKVNFGAIKEIRRIVIDGTYDLVHCHTPIAAVCTRIACRKLRKTGLKVMYTAHGFHFCKTAPKKNWLMFYPVEWLLAHWTDVLITINEEDYNLAKKHMHAKRVEYVPGVGIDLQKFSPSIYTSEEIANLRADLSLDADEIMLLSVGELSTRKNHESVIRALAKVNDPNIKYFICGTGELREYLEELIEELGLSENVKLLGYRTDISKLCCCADLFVFPSLQEGLPVALMEAIASKTAVICSNIRGNTDLVSGNALFEPKNVNQIAEKIEQYIISDNAAEVERNYINLKKFDLEKVVKEMKALYSERGGVTYLERLYLSQQLRKSIGAPIDSKLILSVGELNANKNHEVVIRALAEINDTSIHYAIAGTGDLNDYLEDLAKELGISDRVHLLGYRNDVADLYRAANLYIHSSLREGLPVALMEAIASKTSVICSDIRGNTDLVGGDALFEPKNVNMIADKICEYLKRDNSEEIERNYAALKKYDLEEVANDTKTIYAGQSEKFGLGG